MCDKKQNSFVKRVHLFTDDGLYNRKAFCKVKIVFYSSPVEVIQNVLFIGLQLVEMLSNMVLHHQ